MIADAIVKINPLCVLSLVTQTSQNHHKPSRKDRSVGRYINELDKFRKIFDSLIVFCGLTLLQPVIRREQFDIKLIASREHVFMGLNFPVHQF